MSRKEKSHYLHGPCRGVYMVYDINDVTCKRCLKKAIADRRERVRLATEILDAAVRRYQQVVLKGG